jgi:hypothetical protein
MRDQLDRPHRLPPAPRLQVLCCLCKQIMVASYNAWPLADGICCATCHWARVIPARAHKPISAIPNG